MHRLLRFVRRLLNVVRPHQRDDELAREIAAHVTLLEDEYRRRGRSPEEARREARVALGGVERIKALHRDARSFAPMENFIRDVRSGLRMMRRHWGTTLVLAMTLALGVGLNTAIFSVVESLLLRQLPYGAPDRIVALTQVDATGSRGERVDAGLVRQWAARARTLDDVAIHTDSQLLLKNGTDTEVMRGTRVSASYFEALGVQMLLGRPFQSDEDRLTPAPVLILTYDFWVRRFGQDVTIVGRVLDIEPGPYRVIGILPEGFDPLRMTNRAERPEFFAPASYECDSCAGAYRVVGRLKPDITPQQAQRDLTEITRQIGRESSGNYPSETIVTVEPLLDQLVGPIRPALWTIFGAVSLVLVIACANVASLQLAGATTRSREFAVRGALGGSRGRITGQLLVENLLIACLGGAMGLLGAYMATSIIVALAPRAIPRIDEIRIDGAVLTFSLAVTFVTGLVFGLLPASIGSRVNVNDALKRTAGLSGRASGARVRRLLVVVDVVVAFVLVVTTGLLARSFRNLTAVDAGFDPTNVLTMTPVLMGKAQDRNAATRLEYYRRVIDRIRVLPDVTGVGMASNVPLSNIEPEPVRTEHEAALRDAEVLPADLFWVSPEYLSAMKIPLRRGRSFTAADNQLPAASAIVSESFARRRFPGENPIGRRIQIAGQNPQHLWLTIVGVAADVRYARLDRPEGAAVYLPQSQRPFHYTRIVARTVGDPMQLASVIRGAVRDADPGATTFHVLPMRAYVASALAERTFAVSLIAVFGTLALLLSGIGVYSLVSHSVAHRTAELGMRAALGATPRDLLWLILRDGAALTATGILGGALALVAVGRVISEFLFGVSTTDPGIPLATAGILAAVTLAATYLPARAATRVDPMIALRSWHAE
jgi:putative ABC transport system permease protein